MVAMKWYIGSFESHVGISYSVPPSSNLFDFVFNIWRFQSAGSSNTQKTSLKDQEAGGSKKNKKTSVKDQEAGSSKKN